MDERIVPSSLWTYKDVSHFLAAPVATIYSWVCQRRIPHVRTGPRCVRFDPAEILAWVNASRQAPLPTCSTSTTLPTAGRS